MKNAITLAVLFLAYSSFGQIICPVDITINCNQDYTDESVTGQIIVPDSINNGEYVVNYNPILNSCGLGTITARFLVDDNLECAQIITIQNPTTQVLLDTTVMCTDLEFIDDPIFDSGPCGFIGYTPNLDTLESSEMNGSFTVENNYTIIDWCVYDITNGADGLFQETQVIQILDDQAPVVNCNSGITISALDFPITLLASEFIDNASDNCQSAEELRFTFTDTTPSLDPDYNGAQRSSTMTFTNGNTGSGSLELTIYIWDLANNVNSCFTQVTVDQNATTVTCPVDITINCDQDYTDLELTGYPSIAGVFDFYPVSHLPQLNSCGVGTVLATFSHADSVICTQTITVENPYPAFDPSSIIMPEDTTYTDCTFGEFEDPIWSAGSCDFLGFVIDADTFASNTIGEYTIERDFTVIDWCLFDLTNGAQGLYLGGHTVTVIDEDAPIPFCFSAIGLDIADLPTSLVASSFNSGAFDNCTDNKDLRFTFSAVRPELDPEYDASIKSSTRIITEEDFTNGPLILDMYLWDLANNNDFCTVQIDLTTGVADLDASLISSTSNHPNPFNNKTTIKFDLKKSTDVTITVYDVSGKKYFTTSDYFTAGSHSKSVDLSDAPNGTLLYRLTTNNSEVSGKMIKI